MKRVAVLTSGGDAPGMNAAIRAVVRRGLSLGLGVLGVRNGYSGLIAGEFASLGARDVGGIIERGGTILGTSRCPAFLTPQGQEAAVQQLRGHEVEGLVVIGGDGSQAGACALSQRGVPVVGVASTIDNDVVGSEQTIGVTTALDIALEAIDRLRVTASSHRRAFLVEVMGRRCGYLALIAGIAGGAEAIMLPEVPQGAETVAAAIRDAYARGKSHAIVVVAEGAEPNAAALAEYFAHHAERLGFELRATRLGHMQRGGAPGVTDRMKATLLGAAAIEQLQAGVHGNVLGILNGRVTPTALASLAGTAKPLDPQLLRLASVLAE
ncbi:MAG TPA: ATP-dependent 6-phosphofructokinase [Steroidobacteraceae bacterium]|nr:ATP-dependent 6-phosphofructokinase [Steroidobacteraceae bacterium]